MYSSESSLCGYAVSEVSGSVYVGDHVGLGKQNVLFEPFEWDII
jgi:hypothetical protein